MVFAQRGNFERFSQLEDYDGAFKLAEKLYNEDSTNPYYTSVLFKASIKKKDWSKESKLREDLIDNMGNLIVKNRDQYVEAMKLYVRVKNSSIPREKQFENISELRDRYRSEMITYLSEAIDDCMKYLGVNVN